MKTFKMALLAALISSPLAAEGIDKTWEVGVFGEYIKSATGKETMTDWQQIEAGKGLGIDVQKIINERWNARFELAKTRYDKDNGNDTDYGTRFGLDAVYKIKDTDLYVFAGMKRFDNAKDYNAVNVGAGYSAEVSDRVSLYGEAVVYRDLDYGYTDQGLKFGVKYAFGKTKKSPVINDVVTKKAAPIVVNVDMDNDGVNDAQDNCKNTAAGIKVDSTGCALYSEKEVSITLNVPFANNSSQVNDTMSADIQRLADFMNTYKNSSVVIEGHSSIVGDDKYNLVLSQKRADAIKNVLINKFTIDASRLSAKGFGETQLISKGNTPADHKLNRRVIAKITTMVKEVMKKG